jgi:hypothetical protein
VSTVPRSPATQARRELGLRLRQIRKTARLTGQMLADAIGQHFTLISRAERPPGSGLRLARDERHRCGGCAAAGPLGGAYAGECRQAPREG